MVMRLCACAFVCLFLLTANVSAQTLAAPNPIAPAGAIVNPPMFNAQRGFHTFVFTAVPGAEQYQIYVHGTWIWVTAARAECANGETICRAKWSMAFTTQNISQIDYWWVRAWAPSGYSPWSPAVEVNVANSNSLGGFDQADDATHAILEGGRATIDALAPENQALLRRLEALENLIKKRD